MDSNGDSREGSSDDRNQRTDVIPLVDRTPEPQQQSDAEPYGRRRGKDPYRHILPHKTSSVAPSDVDSRKPRVGPLPKKTGSKQRKMTNTLLLHQTDRQNMLKEPVVSETDNNVPSPKGLLYEKKPEIADVNQLNKEGFAALHIAAQSNNLGEMKELLDNHAEVNIFTVDVGLTPLHFAARYGCVEAVRTLINHGANCDASTTDGQRPIHLAARRGLVDVIQVLIEADKDQVSVRNNDLMTPLHMVALNGNMEALRLLINYGAKINVKDVSNISPIMLSVSSGHLDMTETILQTASSQGLSSNSILADTDNEGNSLLHAAATNGQIELVKFLLEKGASVDAVKTGTGQTPLHLAAVMGNVDMAALMIAYGASIDCEDDELMTPLHRAAMYNRLLMVKLLLENGAEIDAVETDGFTPLLLACWKGHGEVARELVAQKADVSIKDNQLKTCLHWCVEMGHYDLVDVIIEAQTGSDMLEHQDRLDHSPMHYAAEIGHERLLKMLICKGARGDTRNVDEKTPLHIASQCGHLPCVEILLEHFPNFLNDDDVDGNTPLLLACQGGHHRVILFLLRMGADICKRNDEGKTVLSLAAQMNRMHSIAILVEHNADINAQDRDKNTPLHIACLEGHYPSAKLLLGAGAELTHKNNDGHFALDVAIKNRDNEISKAILSSKQWESAMSNRDEQGLTPMKKLIEEMPSAAVIVMNYCVTRSHKNLTHPDLEITYDHKYIDPGIDDNRTGKHGRFKGSKDRYFGLRTMALFNREELISHELSQHILSRKWSQFAGRFYAMDVFLYLIFLAFILYYTSSCQLILKENQMDSNGCIIRDVNGTGYIYNDAGDVVRFSDTSLIVAQFVVLIYCGFLFLFKVVDATHQRLAFWLHAQNYPTLVLCVACIIFVVPTTKPPCALQWQAGAIANYIVWIRFILYLQPAPYFGMYVGMFYTTLKSLLKAMTVYIFFIVAFGVSFYICFGRLISFKDVPNSLLTTFVMTLGEINKADIFESDPLTPFDGVGYFIFVMFLFFMPIVLINLTVGIAVGDIEKIFRSAYFDRLRILVSLAWDYETRLPNYMLRKIHKSKTTVRPNRRSVGITGKLKQLLFGDEFTSTGSDDNGEPSQDAPDNTVEIRHIRGSLAIMDIVLQQHTDILKKVCEKFDISHDFEDTSSYKETISSILD